MSSPWPIKTDNAIRVLEVSAFVAAALAGSTLASVDADVIRVDPIGGPIDQKRWPLDSQENSLYWAGLNAGKRSILLDLHSGQGRDLFEHLLLDDPESGVLLTNNPGLDWASHSILAEKRSNIITCLILGHPDGMRAFDYTVNAAVGIPMITGDEGLPVNSVIPTWDIATGLHAATQILAAANRRHTTGEGSEIRLSLFETAVSTLNSLGMIEEIRDSGSGRPRIGNHLYGALGRDFETSDGSRIMVAAISPNQVRGLLQLIDHPIPETDDLPGYAYEHRQTISTTLSGWIKSRPLAQVTEQLDQAGALVGPYQTMEELVMSDGPWAVGPPADTSPAPRLGEHTDQILGDHLGLSDVEIGRLRDQRVVG